MRLLRQSDPVRERGGFGGGAIKGARTCHEGAKRWVVIGEGREGGAGFELWGTCYSCWFAGCFA